MVNTESFFDNIFKNAQENCVLIMDVKGNILKINQAFLTCFGYKHNQLKGQNFSILFTEKDNALKKPAQEIKLAIKKGSKSDNNYLLHKDGTHTWVMGESIFVQNISGEKYIVKIIQNINSQKKLEAFLIETNEFLDAIFETIKDAAFIILNSELRIIRCNKVFLKIFGLKKSPVSGIKLSELGNDFWKSTEIKKQLTGVLVTKKQMKNVHFTLANLKKDKQLQITSKIMETEGLERTILLVITVKK